ncbi:SRPBCC family protein [Ciceribacter sp. L1K22]|uniref:SRPBCC family protein n=1 Tax=Ciceribacter sp. L1K22 TaxID=2820275 RepID=UPI001ABE9B7A|nr:SRPBCC family protein [Ciceribacter sp. L1K22]MBO3760433.1 SRPBCC family protein [Ciceribacter sp. L1K22]
MTVGMISPAPVRKVFTVQASQEKAFDVFTARMGDWWLKSHTISPAGQKAVVVEPFSGGRWYEIGHDGKECEWGKVLDYSRPDRLVLAWQISAEWAYDPQLLTEVEVRFVVVSASETRVEFEHRKLENYGVVADKVREVLGSDGGWTGLLAAFESVVLAG